ncbi:RHS repeat-associated core domain-containing protein [Hymenobacter latericus]|uniref:RHS repeat-associated core domain-containing protein n=1 Tax=Hymenobacter sp. YIM 151858-1 TaxID=2987688 RepID=UPI002226A0CA|nr:RHS repeat-associated core domain-containing protein [Hymenobacter sp. YIM 151858-1]UYZ61204.1 hypothetical protein OIS50_19740 [Hymenobacter sp. YIM 151858-1]
MPKAYARLLVFDADSNLVAQHTVPLTAAANGGYERLFTQVVAPRAGFVTVYVGNESLEEVYFDDITVEHRQGLQVQETQYDPYGLEMAGLNQAPTAENKHTWNGKERQDEFGLRWHDHGWRFFDPTLGRWSVVDPDAEEADQESWGTYQFGLDNAVRYNDLDGRCPGGCPPVRATGNVAKGLNSGLNQRYSIYKMRDRQTGVVKTTGGDTRFGIQDNTLGRIKNGKPVGIPVVRFDKPDAVTRFPHINGAPGSKLHHPIPGGAKTLSALETTGKTLDGVGKVVKPLAIATDVVRIGNAVYQDNGIGTNTIKTSASVAGGWAGAWGGAILGTKVGATLGLLGGPLAEVTVPAGGFVGGIVGGIGGALGVSWLAEESADFTIQKMTKK